ncbi:hypothetical protein FBU30_009128 [Linnemannia zychae]|nr:hypothetical protein FBU30_009128 [Linnemannia zychae]
MHSQKTYPSTLTNSQPDEFFNRSLEELSTTLIELFDSNTEIHDTSEIEMDGGANGGDRDGDGSRNGGVIGKDDASSSDETDDYAKFSRFMEGKDGIALSRDNFVTYDDVHSILHAIYSKEIRRDSYDVFSAKFE